MSIELDANLEANLKRREKQLTSAAALAGAIRLEANLGGTSGSGVHWPSLPNRSSAPGEYPTRQTGRLQAGVAAEDGPGESARVVIHDDLGKLLGLEFSPPSNNPNQPGTPTRDSGGRAPMHRTFTDARTIREMEAAMKRTP